MESTSPLAFEYLIDKKKFGAPKHSISPRSSQVSHSRSPAQSTKRKKEQISDDLIKKKMQQLPMTKDEDDGDDYWTPDLSMFFAK